MSVYLTLSYIIYQMKPIIFKGWGEKTVNGNGAGACSVSLVLENTELYC